MPAEITVEVHEELRALLPGFLDNRQRDLLLLTQSLDNADFTAILRIAHNLKGVGGGYGFDQITALGERLEAAARSSDAAAAATCITEYARFLQQHRVVFV
ncbi:MAG: Hpt domain-containing protein [Pseudomonadota bacterium]|nr:Hpt domain-containing protein [Pseudomonadota bacterium]